MKTSAKKGKNTLLKGKTTVNKKPSDRVKRSEKLTDDERVKLESFISEYDTQVDAIEALGLAHRGTFHSIRKIGSGQPRNIAKIRKALNEFTASNSTNE